MQYKFNLTVDAVKYIFVRFVVMMPMDILLVAKVLEVVELVGIMDKGKLLLDMPLSNHIQADLMTVDRLGKSIYRMVVILLL